MDLSSFTNRYPVLTAIIRSLYARYKTDPDQIIMGHIENLVKKVMIRRN